MKILALDLSTKSTGYAVYDDNKLMVIPASEQVKPVKVIIEGDALVREFTQNTDHQDQTLEYTFTTTYGAEVAFEGLFGTYDIQ